MVNNNWSLATRFLHVGLVLTVTLQLFISLVMTEPGDDGSALGKLLFEAHEIVGFTALFIVISHWAWSFFDQASGGLKHLFPWRGDAWKEVVDDVKGLLDYEMPQGGMRGGLPGLIHGLGLLAVTGIAMTGGTLWLLLPEVGEPGMLAEVAEEFHEGFATLVWTYWIGHGGIAIAHHLLGHDYMKKMFRFSKDKIQNVDDREKTER